jgi:UDP-3-O-[3-hydroxymyristoyl] N-acetylglucosamine deacetylase
VRSERPELVLLDVWMPEVDGIELLRSLQEEPDRPQVIMISGHGNIETAVQATKLGAFDFIEKPFSIDALLAVVNRALEHRALQGGEAGAGTAAARPVPGSNGHTNARRPERTIGRSVIASGHGLHTGVKSGLILNPLPAGRGIVFANLTTAASVPAHVDYIASTGYATTLDGGGMTVGTVEHLLATLHAYGITNALIKVQSEVPTMDGSALGFCQLVEQAGVEDQGGSVDEIVIGEPLRVGGTGADERASPSSRPTSSAFRTRWCIRTRWDGRSSPTCTATASRSRGDRAGAHLRLRQGHEGDGGDGPGGRRPSRQLHPDRRRAHREHTAALR